MPGDLNVTCWHGGTIVLGREKAIRVFICVQGDWWNIGRGYNTATMARQF
jgi:hypothetical protein